MIEILREEIKDLITSFKKLNFMFLRRQCVLVNMKRYEFFVFSDVELNTRIHTPK